MKKIENVHEKQLQLTHNRPFRLIFSSYFSNSVKPRGYTNLVYPKYNSTTKGEMCIMVREGQLFVSIHLGFIFLTEEVADSLNLFAFELSACGHNEHGGQLESSTTSTFQQGGTRSATLYPARF